MTCLKNGKDITISPDLLKILSKESFEINEEKFVRNYDDIVKQREKVRKRHKELYDNDYSLTADEEMDRLDTIEVVLNWILRNDDTELV